jgi:hypothetical protein
MNNIFSSSFTTGPSSTATEPVAGSPSPKGFIGDTITRTLIDSTTQSVYSSSWPTEDINRQIEWYLSRKNDDVASLKKYANWQRKYIDFQATYTAYLLGALTEEEFENESQQYAPDIKSLTVEQVLPEIGRLTRLLDFDLRATELSEYLETEPSVINKALELVNKQLGNILNPNNLIKQRLTKEL